ncbi:MAG: HflC/HflK family protein [Parcubacteria group bacterium GW2011_GWA2_38_13]|nr:MAG: HflC/HflK family protein [Parcubacteria group bacterium GW2011_GWA2_38_13]
MADSLDKIMYSFVMDDVLKGFFIHVPPGYIACVYDLGRGVLKRVYEPGLHLKIPFWQKAKLFNTQTLEYNISKDFDLSKPMLMGDIPIVCTTADKKNVALEGTVLLRLDTERIPEIWQNIGEEFVEKIVRPTIRSRFRMVAAKYNVEDVLINKRDNLEIQAQKELERVFYPRGILVENVLLSNIDEVFEKE